MIHTILIEPTAEPDAVKKEFRKRLMTGGAVIRLSPDLVSADFDGLISRFGKDIEAHGFRSLVLEEIAKDQRTSEAQCQRLAEFGIPAIARALERRAK